MLLLGSNRARKYFVSTPRDRKGQGQKGGKAQSGLKGAGTTPPGPQGTPRHAPPILIGRIRSYRPCHRPLSWQVRNRQRRRGEARIDSCRFPSFQGGNEQSWNSCHCPFNTGVTKVVPSKFPVSRLRSPNKVGCPKLVCVLHSAFVLFVGRNFV